jgi:hypothetical protein
MASIASIPPPPERASQAQAEVRESGDFNVFRSPDRVTIGSKRSAIIPLFRNAVGHATRVLFYKESDDALRPFRAVRFKNEVGHTLGRGVCEILAEGDFQGKCVLESTRPGEEALLIHAKDHGVRVFKEAAAPQRRRMAMKISQGAVYCEELNQRQTVYRVQNSHDEAFALEVDHPREWQTSKIDISVTPGKHEVVDVPSGWRIRVTLAAKGSSRIKVLEQEVVQQRFALNASWFERNVVVIDGPVDDSAGVEECITLQRRIDAIEAEIEQREQAAKTIDEEMKRLLKLIPSVHVEQASEWRTDLGNQEKELRVIRRSEIPKLKIQLREARAAAQEALGRLRFAWKGDASE